MKYNYTEHRDLYNRWCGMLNRVYNNRKGYEDVVVEERWHDFQIFCGDIVLMKNYNTKGFHLDKDLMILGNRIYGPGYCSFVPARINMLLTQTKRLNKSNSDKVKIVQRITKQYKRDLDRKVYKTLMNIDEAYFDN